MSSVVCAAELPWGYMKISRDLPVLALLTTDLCREDRFNKSCVCGKLVLGRALAVDLAPGNLRSVPGY